MQKIIRIWRINVKQRIKSFFTQELIESTYLFCYKRLGNPEDARDLAQDIFCEALSGFRGDREIEYPQGWYWRLAKNRYATYMKKRSRGITECSMEDDSWQLLPQYSREYLFSMPESVIDRMEREEEISRLHAVISKMSRLHREILVQFYIKNDSVQEISSALQIPEGTVKRRLFDARKQIKERMEKMPTVTKLSYAPQEMELWMPRELGREGTIQDVLGKQVLASCYQKPRSVEELSEELQIAPVYLEDKISRLCALEVLKPAGKKFLTDFIVISKNHVTEMMRELDVVYMDFCERISNILEESRQKILDIGFYGADFPEKYLNLVLYYYAMEIESMAVQSAYRKSSFCKGKDGQVYKDFYEAARGHLFGQVMAAEEKPVDYQCKAMDWMMDFKMVETVEGCRYHLWNCYDRAPFASGRLRLLHENNLDLFWELGKCPEKNLTDRELSYVGSLVEMGLAERRNHGIYPTIVMLDGSQAERLNALLYHKIEPLLPSFMEKVMEILDAWLLPRVRKDLQEQYYHYLVYVYLNPASNMIWWGMHYGKFQIPEDYGKTGEGLLLVQKCMQHRREERG